MYINNKIVRTNNDIKNKKNTHFKLILATDKKNNYS